MDCLSALSPCSIAEPAAVRLVLAHHGCTIACSYAAHHAKRVEVIAATDDQLQFELDTTAAEGRQVMLQNPAGASAMKVC